MNEFYQEIQEYCRKKELISSYVDYLFDIYCYSMQEDLVYEESIVSFYKWLSQYQKDLKGYATFLLDKIDKDKVYMEVGKGPINTVSKILRDNDIYTYVITRYLEMFQKERYGFCGDIGLMGEEPVLVNGNRANSFAKCPDELVFMATLDADVDSVGTIMRLDPYKYSVLLGAFGRVEDKGMEYYLNEIEILKDFLISRGYQKDLMNDYMYNDNTVYRRVLIVNRKLK